MNKPWTKEGKILEQVPVHTKYGMKTAGRWKSAAEQPAAKYFPKTMTPGKKTEPISWHEVRERYSRQNTKNGSFSEYLHKYYTPFSGHDSTDRMHQGDKKRETLRRRIVADVVNYANTPPAGEKPVAILMGGGAASGKSFVRDTLINPALKASGVRAGVCDPDAMKEKLPEWDYLVKTDPDNAAGITHKESLRLAESAFYTLMKQGKNILYDKCMRDVGDYRHKIQALHDKGYNVIIIGVTTDIDTALDRAHKRERQLPDKKIRETHSGFATAWEFIKDYADDFQLYDSSTDTLELVENIHGVQNHALMDEFHDRGKNGRRRRALKKVADKYGENLESLWTLYKDGMSFDEIEKLLNEVHK